MEFEIKKQKHRMKQRRSALMSPTSEVSSKGSLRSDEQRYDINEWYRMPEEPYEIWPKIAMIKWSRNGDQDFSYKDQQAERLASEQFSRSLQKQRGRREQQTSKARKNGKISFPTSFPISLPASITRSEAELGVKPGRPNCSRY